jgi:hypothetical protein
LRGQSNVGDVDLRPRSSPVVGTPSDLPVLRWRAFTARSRRRAAMFPTIGSVSSVKTCAGSFWSIAARRPEVAVGGTSSK